MIVDPALVRAPISPAWCSETIPHVTDALLAVADLRDEIAPSCSLSGPHLDEAMGVLSLSWEISRRAVLEALEEWQWRVTTHLYGHRTWAVRLEPSEDAA